MTTLVLFLMFAGYLPYVGPRGTRGHVAPAAVVALVAVLDIPLVNRPVEWWENRTSTRNPPSTTSRSRTYVFTLMLGFLIWAWCWPGCCCTASGRLAGAGCPGPFGGWAIVERRAETSEAEVRRSVGETEDRS
ncbi:MAG: hypothetical protein CM1200mP26_00590 [Acidimicrobiales bacterium]|nr:MAG: hypothetical protein CM1200mP26_00590 [Acidimicrobiales bacterium]